MTEKIPFNTALHTAVQYLKQQQLNSIPDIARLSAVFVPSSELQEKTDRLILAAERKNSRASHLKSAGRAAAIILLAVSLAFTNPAIVTAMKNIVPEFIIEWYDKYTAIVIKSDVHPVTISDFNVTYLPVELDITESYSFRKVYDKDGIHLSISVSPADGSGTHNVDNEHSVFEEIEIEGNKGIAIYHEDDVNSLIISAGGIDYLVHGEFPMDEIIKIYQGIEIVF